MLVQRYEERITEARDPKDAMVLELAVAAGCGYIVTYNKRENPLQGIDDFLADAPDVEPPRRTASQKKRSGGRRCSGGMPCVKS